MTLSLVSEWLKWSAALSFLWLSLSLEPFTHGKIRRSVLASCISGVVEAQLCIKYHVIPRGKGDYHRLGHGSDDHVRRPRQVQGLQGKKVIAIATGSLHCVCCTEDGRIHHFMHRPPFCTNPIYFRSVYCTHSPCQLVSLSPNSPASQKSFVVVFGSGEVYTWGDNDEGQLGDGTTNAIQRPRLVAALQGKKINRVACGSAHTLAWSTSKPTNAGKLPSQVLQLSAFVCWTITYHMFQ